MGDARWHLAQVNIGRARGALFVLTARPKIGL